MREFASCRRKVPTDAGGPYFVHVMEYVLRFVLVLKPHFASPSQTRQSYLKEKIMFIEGTKHTKVSVEVSAKQLCNAVEECEKITLVEIVSMLAKKMNAELDFNNNMYIEDGWWYLTRMDHYDALLSPMKKRKASKGEMEIMDAIIMLVAVIVIYK